MSFRQIMSEAEKCRRIMGTDRSKGKACFDGLLSRYGEDGMIYFKRAEGYEELGEHDLSYADYTRAETLFPMPEWRQRAREGSTRVGGILSTAMVNRAVTVESFEAAMQASIWNLLAELRKRDGTVQAAPTKTYLGIKRDRALICAFYPVDRETVCLGHWSPPSGGRHARWVKPVVSSGLSLYYGKLLGRLEHLIANDLEASRTKIIQLGRIPVAVGIEKEEGGLWNSYRLDVVLGEGGMGVVYRAFNEADPSDVVAVKMMSAKGATEELRARFRREVRLHADSLDHPNIITLLKNGLDAKWPFFVMEYAHSGTLRDWLLKQEHSIHEALSVFRSVCAGIAHAHEQGVIHRDIKPENILQVRDGVWKVSDFGLCVEVDRQTTTLTRTDLGMGTWVYCAPEQMQNAKSVDTRADVYSLGVVLYELLTGFFPPVRPSDVSNQYRSIVEQATERDPDKRYQSVQALLRAVDDASLSNAVDG